MSTDPGLFSWHKSRVVQCRRSHLQYPWHLAKSARPPSPRRWGPFLQGIFILLLTLYPPHYYLHPRVSRLCVKQTRSVLPGMPLPIFCSYRPFLFVIFYCSPALCVPRLVDACLQMKGWKLFLKSHLLVVIFVVTIVFFFFLSIYLSLYQICDSATSLYT